MQRNSNYRAFAPAIAFLGLALLCSLWLLRVVFHAAGLAAKPAKHTHAPQVDRLF